MDGNQAMTTGGCRLAFRWTWLDGATSFVVMLDNPRRQPDGTLDYGPAIRVDLTAAQTKLPLAEREGLIQGALAAVAALMEKTGTAPPRPIPVVGEAT